MLSGSARGAGASALRTVLGAIEPAYGAVMRARNFAFDHGMKRIHRLPRPAVAVGNLTTGGTGKTPIVRWLAEHFAERNLRPAILLRGYRAELTGGSDEARMLEAHLGDRAFVVADPDRVAGSANAMKRMPPPDVFILDDAFQHRRVWRDFNLLVMSAIEPFGLGHVLPRGYLREPVSGIKRADAIVITRADQVSEAALGALRQEIHRLAGAVRVYQASHAQTAARCAERIINLDEFNRQRFFAFSGIAKPESFYQQLPQARGTRSFPDHHAYTERDLAELDRAAKEAGAEILVTTEKDWIKLAKLARSRDRLPIWRVEMEVRFAGDDQQRLLEQIENALRIGAATIPPG
jgi:tetraacyldisaccharide 4'-kinase